MKTTGKKKSSKKVSSRSSNKSRKKKLILTTFTIGAASVLGYFGWQYFKRKKDTAASIDFERILPTDMQPTRRAVDNTTTSKTSIRNIHSTQGSVKDLAQVSEFPLKRGSKGETVRTLQRALIAKHGNEILSRYGADGQFGNELANTLKKLGLPSSITESTFNVITQSLKTNVISIGKDLYEAASSNDFNKALGLLRQLQSSKDYAEANDSFKQFRLNGVRQTIVNGLLNSFTNESQKEAIKLELLRMGLQFDGTKWSLSGFDGRPIVTKEGTTVWLDAINGVPVPGRMLLGNEISQRLDYTLFENNGKYFLVKTKSVQYLN